MGRPSETESTRRCGETTVNNTNNHLQNENFEHILTATDYLLVLFLALILTSDWFVVH